MTNYSYITNLLINKIKFLIDLRFNTLYLIIFFNVPHKIINICLYNVSYFDLNRKITLWFSNSKIDLNLVAVFNPKTKQLVVQT